MSEPSLEIELTEKFDTLLERMEVNKIICYTNMHDVKGMTKEEIDNYLNENNYHKIEVNSTIVLNEIINNGIGITQNVEDDFLESEIKKVATFIDSDLENRCKRGENVYELNELVSGIISKLDATIDTMNLDSWLERKASTNYSGLFYVVINNERFEYNVISLDIQTFRLVILDNSFLFRANLLRYLKSKLVDLYSKYLVYPSFDTLPAISYNCTKTDVCELIIAMMESKGFEEPEKLKAVFLGVFGIGPKEFTACRDTITKRRTEQKKSRNKFVQELSNGFY